MRFVFSSVVVVVITLVASMSAAGEGLRPYKHPDLDMRFSAPHGWLQRPRPGDEGTHERVDPRTGIHVLMWCTTTCMSAERYLGKMSHMMDLVLDAQSRPRILDGREAWVLGVPGTVAGRAVKTLLAVIPSGKSRQHPLENNLYICQIWCPAENYMRLASSMEGILRSIRVPTGHHVPDSPAD